MIELTGTQVAKLNDTDLRELVFRLCEAELRRNNQPVAAVTASGNQTAPDGGIDVRVELSTPAKLDFIPRSQTGFQVKCEDMPAAKLKKEMCPGGKLRPSILQLIEAGGAYIIVSSKGSVADGPRLKRIEAMRAAITSATNTAVAHLDFYDRDRLATWVRGYPGVEHWLRGRIGEPLSGWKGYDNWAGDKADAPYLKDDLGRIFSKTTGNPEAMSVAQGIDAIRRQLENPGQAVRLIGLSGTGKTRLVQALFESEAGGQPLDKAIAVYTDQGDSPIPSARDMMEKLGANGLRSIVVVDNCTPETHQTLAKIVTAHSSCLSLITVEYDVRDDEPEETQVFELTGSSPTVLDGILASLAPHVAQSDRWRIVEFSDGNARVALALVRTLKKGQTLGFLNDNELFKRLFMQNQGPDETLLRAAEACSLVYSFEGKTIEGADAELPILAALADLTPKELLRQVTTLKNRQLVQTRSKWRAILPHALANRLAKQALAHLPRTEVMSAFQGHERLLKSFSRRLSYLHDSPEACEIAQQWMEEWLPSPATLNDLGRALFFNLAPLVPEQALAKLETAVNGDHRATFISSDWSSRNSWMALTHSLAYEAPLFDRAARICLAYAEFDELSHQTGKTMWKELFHIYLSGTMAPPQQRIKLLQHLLISGTPKQQELALVALSGMLQSNHFGSSRDFGFGARPRGFGWQPESQDDYKNWYRSVFELVVELTNPGSPYRDLVRAAVARQLRQLWGKSDLHQEVCALVKTLAGMNGWPEGWAATQKALRYKDKEIVPDHLESLNEIEKFLRPETLEQNIRSYVFTEVLEDLQTMDETGVSFTKILELRAEKAEQLAKEVIVDESLLQRLLPELLSRSSGQIYAFGKGLAIAAPDITTRWNQLCTAFFVIERSNRSTHLLMGFVERASQVNPEVTEKILDLASQHPILIEYFLQLQGGRFNNEAGNRLLKFIDLTEHPASGANIASLHLRRGEMSSDLYRALLLKLAKMPDGFQIAIKSLYTKIFCALHDGFSENEELISHGRELLNIFNFEIDGEDFEYNLNEVASVCLQGASAVPIAIPLCQRFAEALNTRQISTYSFGTLAETLFRHQPATALDAFLLRTPQKMSLLRQSSTGKSIVSSANTEALLAWVKVEPSVRVPLLATEIEIYCQDVAGLFSWSPIAASLLEIAPNKQEVLDGFSENFRHRAWSGSISGILRPYQEFAMRLTSDADATVAAWAKVQLASIVRRIAQENHIYQRTDQHNLGFE